MTTATEERTETAVPRVDPLSILLPYQRRWVEDGARFKIGMWARQTGKTFSCGAECVRDCLTTPRTRWVVMSRGERQSLEFVCQARLWTEAYEVAIEGYEELRGGAEALLRSAEITWPNGSRLTAIPANPDTARGYSANLVLDEFAHHEKPDDIWRAVFPMVTNPLRGELRLRVVSTPAGRANKFYDLWTKNEEFSRHKITIYDAVAQGLPVKVEELKRAQDDPDGWAQEYECEFIDASAILLPYELIAACEHSEAREDSPPDQPHVGPLFVGVDIGRKRDLTVCWTLEKLGDVLWTREVLVLPRMPFAQQRAMLALRMAAAAQVCIDSTGIGAQLAEEFAYALGEWRVQQCQFTAALKQEIFVGMRRAFEERGLRVPVSRAIREDLHGLQKLTTSAGNIRFAAPHNEDGHCDRATALALALHAARSLDGAPGIVTA